MDTESFSVPASSDGLSLLIQPVAPSLLQPMIAFGSVHYPAGNPNLDVAYLHWLTLENPAGVAQAVVIRDGDHMVGLALLIPIPLSFDGRQKIGNFVVNVLTHPEYRNRRLFSRIIDAAKDYCRLREEWLMGHPNQAAIGGWTRKEMTFRAPLVAMIGGLGLGVGRRTVRLDSEQKLREEWPDVASALTLKPGEVGIQRSIEFMRWRFLARPDRSYTVALSRDGKGRLAGFWVARPFKRGVSLMVDHGMAGNGSGAMSIGRPCITMVPADRLREIGAETRSIRLPVRKEMPFFATCFDGTAPNFSRITLAASDF